MKTENPTWVRYFYVVLLAMWIVIGLLILFQQPWGIPQPVMVPLMVFAYLVNALFWLWKAKNRAN